MGGTPRKSGRAQKKTEQAKEAIEQAAKAQAKLQKKAAGARAKAKEDQNKQEAMKRQTTLTQLNSADKNIANKKCRRMDVDDTDGSDEEVCASAEALQL